MELTRTATTLLLALAVAAAVHATDSTATAASPASFILLPVGEEPGASEISSSNDTVSFTFYFVDTECETFFYDYRLEKRALVVTRRPVDSLSCTTEGQAIYGLGGTIAGVAPGRYWFELRSTCGAIPEVLLKEAVEVRAPK
jgi:hypothetical protein